MVLVRFFQVGAPTGKPDWTQSGHIGSNWVFPRAHLLGNLTGPNLAKLGPFGFFSKEKSLKTQLDSIWPD